MEKLIARRKALLQRESMIINRRTEIFKIENPTVVTEELKKLNLEAQRLRNDWWDLDKEITALPKWKLFIFNARKDL